MRTLTWDQGREMARHQRLTHDTGVDVFFAHPHSPWERGTNENTNRLIRRYLPKGTPITSHQPYLDAIAYELNNCPRAPSATAPQQKHSTNSLLPPIDTAVLPMRRVQFVRAKATTCDFPAGWHLSRPRKG